jgi:NAD-specific glutamate dehydrogenase
MDVLPIPPVPEPHSNADLKELLEELQTRRLKLMARFRVAVEKDTLLGEVPRLVREYRQYLSEADRAIAQLDATANHAAVTFTSADAMFLRSLELREQALTAQTRDEFVATLEEARLQHKIAVEAMADAVFDMIRLGRSSALPASRLN